MDRRHFLKLSAYTLGSVITSRAAWASDVLTERSISLHNLHTGDKFQGVYWAGGQYLPESLRAVDRVLRDHRTGEIHPMDRVLLDQLHRLCGQFSFSDPMEIISGFRSAKTNTGLRKGGHHVARKSFHLTGQAIDLRLPGVAHHKLLQAALDLRAGGVGNYPGQNFIHLDTGPYRTW